MESKTLVFALLVDLFFKGLLVILWYPFEIVKKTFIKQEFSQVKMPLTKTELFCREEQGRLWIKHDVKYLIGHWTL